MKYAVTIISSLTFFITACSAGSLEQSSLITEPLEPGLEIGTGKFTFTGSPGSKDHPVTVHYHQPEGLTKGSPILFVMHGNGRNAEGYQNAWIPYAEQKGFLVVTPEFSRDHYPSTRNYHQGNLFESDGTPIDSAYWSFTTVEAIFDEIVRRTGSVRERYFIYGHSAGSQFVHRMVFMMPDARIEEAIAANAGWYTLPTDETEWPYGLGGVPSESSLHDRLEKALSKPVTVLLGDADTSTTASDLRRTEEAMEQGRHRFERGHYFYDMAQEMAAENGLPFEWTLEPVPGVAHSNKGMASVAAAIIDWSRNEPTEQ